MDGPAFAAAHRALVASPARIGDGDAKAHAEDMARAGVLGRRRSGRGMRRSPSRSPANAEASDVLLNADCST
jgi:hypothetical protein